MKERQRRLYRAVITDAPENQEPPNGVLLVPRMVYDGRGSQANIVYLAHLHDQAHQELGRAPLDPHDYEGDDLWVGFYPGQSRTFHARANAERKARLWRAHGCEVRIDVSEPIVWKIGADQ